MAELVWDGKYGPDGREVAPVRVALPFQTVETVTVPSMSRPHRRASADPSTTAPSSGLPTVELR